jgi:GH43 family beta-xylosidase
LLIADCRFKYLPPMSHRSSRYAAAFALVLLASCAGCSKSSTGVSDTGGVVPQGCTFLNPVAYGADPWVVRHEGTYYLIQSRDGGIWISRSPRLSQVAADPGVRIWTPPPTGWNRTNVWAPELHLVDGRWYVYYAAGASGPPYVAQRAGVLESAGADPLGPYTDRGMLFTGDAGGENVWAIDLTVGRIGGQLYAVWSGWERNATTDRTPQSLYIARMSSPTAIAGPRVKLSAPTESWERGTELDLQEGPTFLEHGGQLFVVYSTRESWLRDYRLGMLRFGGGDPLDPASWTKTGPVFAASDVVYGPGHASFTTSPDGSESWIVYHAKTSTTPGWERVIRMQKFGWSADGAPDFGRPVPSGALPAPAGECR